MPPAGSYYLTTTYGALEHIKNYDKITVTRQLSVEVQDSIHRWERRRTLNKARASRSSVQVRPGTERVGGDQGILLPDLPYCLPVQEQWHRAPSLPVCAGLGAGVQELRAEEKYQRASAFQLGPQDRARKKETFTQHSSASVMSERAVRAGDGKSGLSQLKSPGADLQPCHLVPRQMQQLPRVPCP